MSQPHDTISPTAGSSDEHEASRTEETARLRELETLLAERDRHIDHLTRRGRIDEALRDAGASDMDVARLLVERAMDETPSLEPGVAVADVALRKPYLFERASSRHGNASPPPRAQSPRVGGSSPQGEAVTTAAAEAQATGARSDLLRYLRLRRRSNPRAPG